MADFTKLSPSLTKPLRRKIGKYVADKNKIREAISDLKRKKRKKPIVLECRLCDKSFQPKRYWAEFCSDNCRYRWHNKTKYIMKLQKEVEHDDAD